MITGLAGLLMIVGLIVAAVRQDAINIAIFIVLLVLKYCLHG